MSVADVRYVLPEDADVVELPGDEVLVSRRGSRVTPQLLSADAMELLEQFRTPSTLTTAVLAYCAATRSDPVPTLEAAFPVLVALTRADLLVAEGTSGAVPFEERRRVGEEFGPATVTARVRTLRDSEVWRARLADGAPAVVKIVDEPVLGPDLVAREVAALERLAASGDAVAPTLLWHERTPTGGVLVMTEVVGTPVDLAVAGLDDRARRSAALALVDAYVAVHACGVLHGDVHAGNALLRPDGRVTLLDFGLAHVLGEPGVPGQPPPRTAGGEGLDPQSARALLAGEEPPHLDVLGEQYAVGALVHRVLTSRAHLDLACERSEALQRILSDRPRRLEATGTAPWPSGERVLRRALERDPAHRYPTTTAFRADLAAAVARGASPSDDEAARRDGAGRRAAEASREREVRRAVRDLDVDGDAWRRADLGEAAHAAWFLRRVAVLTGDGDAHDLAALWVARAGGGSPPRPAPDDALTRMHRELVAWCRTGRPVHLSRARGIATRLGTAPVWTVDVRRGRWASVLAALECDRAVDAVLPGDDVVPGGAA